MNSRQAPLPSTRRTATDGLPKADMLVELLRSSCLVMLGGFVKLIGKASLVLTACICSSTNQRKIEDFKGPMVRIHGGPLTTHVLDKKLFFYYF